MAIEKELRSWKSNLERELADLTKENQKLLGKIARLREQIDAIDRLLPGSQSRETAPWKMKVESSNPEESYVPVHAYWPVILQTLVELGGSARSEHVLEMVGKKMDHVLSVGDRQTLPSGIDVRWKNRAAWQRYNMVQQGLLKRGSPRGIWEISEQGRRWLQEVSERLAQK